MPASIRLLWFAATDAALPPSDHASSLGVIRLARSASEALASLERLPAHVAVIDASVPAGLELLRRLSEAWPELGLVALVSDETRLNEANRAGAVELLEWPGDRDALQTALARAAKRAERSEHQPPPLEVAHKPELDGIIGGSKAMQGVREAIGRVAQGNATVLIRGETGTGKELAARAVHRHSPRSAGPFIAVHAAALPDELLESELFGYERGAFTGAANRKPGRVELAEGGTLFLDEIAEVTPKIQAKLLRLLQEREFERLGGTQLLKADVRFIAATHRDLEHMVELGEFRQDLFYRLNVMTLWLPPLRARRDDIGELAEHFAKLLGEANGRPGLEFDAAALKILRSERWPGNVRQLMNLVERLAVLANSDTIAESEVRGEFEGRGVFRTESTFGSWSTGGAPDSSGAPSRDTASVRPLKEEVRRAERKALLRALESAKGNRTLAARLLGVGRRTLYSKLEEHGLV